MKDLLQVDTKSSVISMKKKDLCEIASVSSTSLAKMRRNENVNTDILVKICEALNCDISDIAEIVDKEE